MSVVSHRRDQSALRTEGDDLRPSTRAVPLLCSISWIVRWSVRSPKVWTGLVSGRVPLVSRYDVPLPGSTSPRERQCSVNPPCRWRKDGQSGCRDFNEVVQASQAATLGGFGWTGSWATPTMNASTASAASRQAIKRTQSYTVCTQRGRWP